MQLHLSFYWLSQTKAFTVKNPAQGPRAFASLEGGCLGFGTLDFRHLTMNEETLGTETIHGADIRSQL